MLQLFKKEEQNFVFANEIDNMALIMPSQDKKTAGEQSDAAARKPKGKTRMGITQSLNVACLRRSVSSCAARSLLKSASMIMIITSSVHVCCRLLPIGLNMFGGREQELVQKAKQRLIEVRIRTALPSDAADAHLASS